MKILNVIGLDYCNLITAEPKLKRKLLFDLAENLFCIFVLTAQSIKTLVV